ncbi:MAG: hypothetical protein LBC53_03365 [Spirochaetaceae bacterium]|nr:hypothetical protein [Spirochaetaceae bacterium]
MINLNMPVEGGVGINLTILTIIFSVILNEFVAKKIEKIRLKRIGFFQNQGRIIE